MMRSESARTALLGISVVDAFRREAVTGLRAWAWDARFDAAVARGLELSRVRAAGAGPGGVLAWHELPSYAGWSAREGLRSAAASDSYEPRIHTIVVVDPSGRLHPICAEQTVPGPLAADGEREGLLAPLPLRAFPTATHAPPDGVVVARARLWDVHRQGPAAWALLRVTVGELTYEGLAGDDGQVAVFVPVPRLRGGVSLSRQSWSIVVQVHYGRLSPRLTSDRPHPITGLQRVPPTASAIAGQPAVPVYTTAAATEVFVPPDLPALGELILLPKLPAAPVKDRETRLFVTP